MAETVDLKEFAHACQGLVDKVAGTFRLQSLYPFKLAKQVEMASERSQKRS